MTTAFLCYIHTFISITYPSEYDYCFSLLHTYVHFYNISFSVLKLLIGRQEGHSPYKSEITCKIKHLQNGFSVLFYIQPA